MLNSKNSVTSYNKMNNSDLRTAVKSNYQDYSPYRQDIGTPNLKSPARYNAKFQQARDSISYMIQEMSSKRDENHEAVERVRVINGEALGILSSRENINFTPSKTQRDSQKRGGYSGNYEEVPPFAQQQYKKILPEDEREYAREFNLAGGDDGYSHPLNFDNRNLTLEQENVELRKALNYQIRQNNELLKRIRFLESQNEDLRNQLGIGLHGSKGLRSTKYNSFNYGDMSNLGRADYPQSPRIYGSPVRQQYGDYGQNVNNYNNYNTNSGLNVYSNSRELLNELDDLKAENERLRQNAITLLRN